MKLKIQVFSYQAGALRAGIHLLVHIMAAMSILWSFSISVAHVVTSEHDARCNTDKKKKKKTDQCFHVVVT